MVGELAPFLVFVLLTVSVFLGSAWVPEGFPSELPYLTEEEYSKLGLQQVNSTQEELEEAYAKYLAAKECYDSFGNSTEG
ncbi:hypothetical protein E3E23_05335 [Thermococcus sp. CX2]|uniref:hypothetical protein n=1 Tax=Thermococcus sp. CX2 TaxID=163006 RepID=UPI00143984DA|nr:hypothetical protein [Thermococcus sp. CX2]NJE85247.1 hypothetical protein [Thermococcus sp. CX2]